MFSLSLHTAAATMPLRPITPALPMPWTFLHRSALWGHKKTKSKTIGPFHAKNKALDTAYFLRYSGLFKWSRCRDLNPGPFGPEWDYGAFHAFCIWLFSPKFRRILAYVLLMLSQVFPLWENQIENQYGASTRRKLQGSIKIYVCICYFFHNIITFMYLFIIFSLISRVFPCYVFVIFLFL